MKRFLTLFLLVLVINSMQYLNGNRISVRPEGIIPDQDQKEGLYAELNTNKGRIVVRLDYRKAPMTVANFVGLTEGTIHNASYAPGIPFYKGSIWHRVVKGHVIQGGSPVVDKAPEREEVGATGYVIPNEITDLSHNKAGMFGIANSGPHTNTCQYYITLGDRSYLDGNYTVFGEVVEGLDVVFNIVQGDTTRSISIIRRGADSEKFVVNDVTFRKMVEEQWEKVRKEEALRKKNDEKFIIDNYPGLKVTASGLRYKTISEGTGDYPPTGSKINAKYSGKLINGTSFLSTLDAGKPGKIVDPEIFIHLMGSDLPTKGFDEGVSSMRLGEKRLLIIPPGLAYGINGFYARDIPGQKRFVISPDEILIIEVTLISWK